MPSKDKKPAAPAKKAAAPAAKKAKTAPAKNSQPAKKTAAAPKKAAPVAKKTVAKKADAKKQKTEKPKTEKKPRLSQHQRIRMLIQRPAKVFRIGQDLPPSRDMTRLVRWPRYIRLQRQRAILLKRLKMPPPLNHFNHVLDKATAVQLFKILHKYRPEEGHAKKLRRLESAAMLAKAKRMDGAARRSEREHKAAVAKKAGPVEKKKREKGVPKPAAPAPVQKPSNVRDVLASLRAKKPIFIKKGLNHVTSLVEKGKAQLVVIAHDVDPIELVVWLPALCRKKKIPYCIVKGKSRLGQLVHKKTAAVIALTNVRKEDRAEFDAVLEVCRSQYNDNAPLLKQWSEQKFGIKHRQAEAKRMRRLAKEEASKATA